MNTKSAYASAVLIIFIRNLGLPCESITDVMKFADKQMQQLGIKNNLSESTRYAVVRDMLDNGILISKTRKNGKKHKVYLSKQVTDYMVDMIKKQQEVVK